MSLKKENFLSNPDNKQKFICLLSSVLREAGIFVFNAEGDADVIFMKTAVHFANTQPTTVVGEDTDILVL